MFDRYALKEVNKGKESVKVSCESEGKNPYW
jgi:hypothetical protein